MTPLLLAALLAVQAAPDRAEALVRRIAFPAEADVKAWHAKGPEYKTVLDAVLKRETWTAAVKSLEEALVPFGDDWTFTVGIEEWDGEHPAHGERAGKAATIRFNLRKLGAYERKMIDFRRQDEELRKQGKRMGWKVPPLKYDRLVAHELVHVLQGAYESPGWFHEGIASWIGADPNYVMGYLFGNAEIADVETAPPKADDVYGRGQLFFTWLEQKSGKAAIKKLAKATIGDGTPAKESLEKLLGMEWAKISAEELAWTREYGRKKRPK